MTNDNTMDTLLPRYAKINRNALVCCAIVGFAVAAPLCWYTACLRLLLDTTLLISMGVVSGKLIRAQTQRHIGQVADATTAASCPEQIGLVQPLGQTQSVAQQSDATHGSNDSSCVTVSQTQLKRLHEQLVQAQQANGEQSLDFNSLQEVVHRTTKQIFAQHSCQGVAFEVIRHQGKVTLQPRILREPQSPQDHENRA